MGLFDIMSGWALWAPCTIITCGLMGFVVGLICTKWKGYIAKVVAMIAALGIKLLGYYVFEAFIMGNGMAAALKSVPGNIIQVGMAMLIVMIIIEPLSAGVRMISRNN